MEQNIAGINEAKCFQCNRSEFLPFKCGDCQKLFCDEHKRQESHSCKNQSNKNKRYAVSEEKSVDKIRCQQCKIILNNINKIQCKQCNLFFCTKHRLFESHSCSGLNNIRNNQKKELKKEYQSIKKKDIQYEITKKDEKPKKQKKGFFFCCIKTNN